MVFLRNYVFQRCNTNTVKNCHCLARGAVFDLNLSENDLKATHGILYK